MRTLSLGMLGNCKVKLYQDIDETPIEQYNLFNEYSLKSSELGNTIEDVDRKFGTLSTLIASKQNDKAAMELSNIYQTHWSILNKVNYKSLQFGCILYSINDEIIKDYSQDNLTLILARLSKKGLSMKMVKVEIENLKKNFKYSSN